MLSVVFKDLYFIYFKLYFKINVQTFSAPSDYLPENFFQKKKTSSRKINCSPNFFEEKPYYLLLLSQHIYFPEIVAITFTNKQTDCVLHPFKSCFILILFILIYLCLRG